MSSWTHLCEVDFGFQVPGWEPCRRTVRLVVKDTRYEDQFGYWYDRHMVPGRAIVSGAPSNYFRQLDLSTLRPIAARTRVRLSRERVRL